MPSRSQVSVVLSSPPVLAGLLAVVVWAPITGLPSWPSLSRGRWIGAVAIIVAVDLSVFALVQGRSALTAP